MANSDLATVLRETHRQLHRIRKSVLSSGHLDVMRDIDSLVGMAEDDAKNLLQKISPCADASPATSPGPKSTDSVG
jgi:hypothetical protein